MTPRPALEALTRTCRYRLISTTHAITFCLSLSVFFVAALYFVVVPANIRALERDDPRQIKWRILAVTTVCIVSTLVYPFLFCTTTENKEKNNETNVSALQLMGWTTLEDTVSSTLGVLLHAILLYTGPIVTSLLYVQYTRNRLRSGGRNISYTHTFYLLAIEPYMEPFTNYNSSQERWTLIRNLFVAPLSEEIIFRGCIVSILLASGLPPLVTCFVAPLFFGTAHVHHAYYLKYKQGMSVKHVMIMTTFQLSYTTLFGAYTTFCFLRTGSIVAITTCHSFCNLMGLPDLGFLQPQGSRLSCLYPYKWLLVTSYIVGICAFVWGFWCFLLIPPPPGRLVEAVVHDASPSMQ